MSFVAIDFIAGGLFQIFGNGFIFSLFIITFMIILLFMFRANLATILIVMVPVILGFTLNSKFTNFIELPPWILYTLFIAMAFVFTATAIFTALRD